MAAAETIQLVKRAKAGDAKACDDLIARYYNRWLARFHGDLGSTIHSLHSTQDIVQSALLEADQDIGSLRNEGAFFAWVTMIIKHKIAQKRRSLRGKAPGGRKRAFHDRDDNPVLSGLPDRSLNLWDPPWLRTHRARGPLARSLSLSSSANEIAPEPGWQEGVDPPQPEDPHPEDYPDPPSPDDWH